MRRLLPLPLALAALLALPGPGGAATPVDARPVAAGGPLLSPQVAARPGAPAVVVAAATELRGGSMATAAFHSTDGGASWTEDGDVAVGPSGSGGQAVPRGTPAVAIGAAGDAYVAQEALAAGDPCDAGSGVYLSRSTTPVGPSSATVAFDAGVPVAPSGPSARRGRPSLAVDGTGAPVVAVTATAAGGGCAPGARRVELAYESATGPGTWELLDLSGDPATLGEAEAPVIVRVAGGVAVAYLRHLPNGLASIEVARCSSGGTGYTCSSRPRPRLPAFTPATTLAYGAGSVGHAVTVTSAPDLAVGPDGSLHVAYTARSAAGDLDVLYSRSPDGSAWLPPENAADPGAVGADQFLPAVAVSPVLVAGGGYRADVSLLDRRADGNRVQPVAQSFRTVGARTLRGQNVALTAAPAPLPIGPGGAPTAGERIDAVSGPAAAGAPGGHAGTLTAAAGSGGDALVFRRVAHGSTPPVLPTAAAATTKNRLAPLPGLLAATDADGDPVDVAVAAAPSNGSLEGDAFRPAAGFVGQDALRVRADDGYGNAPEVRRVVTVANRPPALRLPAGVVPVPEGGAWAGTLDAEDPDPGDALLWSLTSVPPALAGRVRLTPAGALSVDLPPGVRAAGILRIGVAVSDSTPQADGRVEGETYLRIVPAYAAPRLAAGADRATGTTVQFRSSVADPDPEAGRRSPLYRWTFSDGQVSTLPSPRIRFARGGWYAWTLTVVVPRSEGDGSRAVVVGRVAVAPSGASLLDVATRIDRRRRVLMVALRSRSPGRVTLAATLRAGRRSVTRRAVVRGGSGRLGRVSTVTLPLRGLAGRTADLAVRHVPAGEEPAPTPVTAKIRLR